MPIAPGTRLGAYVVEEFIGQGAMGVVFRAYHAQLERTAAVKVLQALTPDTDMVARFRREAQSIGRMRHPNVLNVFDFGEFEGTPYMVVEYVQGGSLAGRTKQGPLDRESTLSFLRGIGGALDYAHSLGIVHRDVKPANVLLGARDTPILADFGLAKLLQSSSIKSMTGVTTGTPAYMAPEQVTGSQVGPAADRYSLAVMGFEMLTGSLPFEAEGVLEVLYAHVHRDPPVPSSLNPQLGPEVDAVVLRGMAKDPAGRWDSCASFVSALEDSLNVRPIVAAESTAVMAPTAAVGAAIAAPSTAVVAPPAPPMPAAEKTAVVIPPPRKRRRRSVLFAFIAAALVLMLIVGGVLVYAATRPTTLSVSPQLVRPGEHVVVSAHHVPRNQAGDIQLVGTARSVAFRSNANGDVSVEMIIPAEISAGDYILRICWSGACHAQTTLQVAAPLALVTPGGSPSSVSPSPGVSPAASPTPRVTPSPVATLPSVTASPSANIKPLTTKVVVSGSHFTPHATGTISVIQGARTQSQTTAIDASGSFVKNIYLQGSWTIGPAMLKVCDTANLCAQITIGIA